MRTTIPAVLDLDKALKSFREAVVSVMEIGEVSHWDGNELRQREQQIRQASLVLAGQCIALLKNESRIVCLFAFFQDNFYPFDTLTYPTVSKG